MNMTQQLLMSSTSYAGQPHHNRSDSNQAHLLEAALVLLPVLVVLLRAAASLSCAPNDLNMRIKLIRHILAALTRQRRRQ